MKKNEVLRAYSFGDAYMLETADTLHGLFLDKVADFTAMDTTLDANFGTDWLALIDAARAIVSDSQVRGIQAVKTSDVLDQMELCRKKYIQVKYFVSMAYPDSLSRQEMFKLSDYDDVRQSQNKMLNFMDDLHATCENNSAELIAAGMTQAQIDEIRTLFDGLRSLNKDQEDYMRLRPVLTEERVVALNACYSTTMRVVNAAQSIYYDNYALRRAFTFNPTGGNSGGDEDDSVTINATIINDNNAVELYSVPYLAQRQITVTNNGPEDVEIFIANSAPEMGTPQMVSAGDTQTFNSDNLGPDGDKIFVRSMSPSGGETTLVLEIGLEE